MLKKDINGELINVLIQKNPSLCKTYIELSKKIPKATQLELARCKNKNIWMYMLNIDENKLCKETKSVLSKRLKELSESYSD